MGDRSGLRWRLDGRHAVFAAVGVLLAAAGIVRVWIAVVEIVTLPSVDVDGGESPTALIDRSNAQSDIALAVLLTAIGVVAVLVAMRRRETA